MTQTRTALHWLRIPLTLAALCLAALLLCFRASASSNFNVTSYSSTDYPALGEIVDITFYAQQAVTEFDELELRFSYDSSVLVLESYDLGPDESESQWSVTPGGATWEGPTRAVEGLLLTLHMRVLDTAQLGDTVFSFQIVRPTQWETTAYHNSLVLHIAGEHSEILAQGDEGSLTWTLSEDGTLSVAGTGAISDYAGRTDKDYDSYADYGAASWQPGTRDKTLTSLTIEEGITELGDYAFVGLDGIAAVSLPASLTSIGQSPVPNGSYTVSYAGTASDWENISLASSNAWLALSHIQAADGPVYEYLFDMLVNQLDEGDGLTKTFYANGLVVVSRNEDVTQHSDLNGYLCYARYYLFQPGITHLEQSLLNDAGPDWLYIPDTVTEIDSDFFSLFYFDMPEGDDSVSYISLLSAVYYGGTEAEWDALVSDCDDWAILKDLVDMHYDAATVSWQGSNGAVIEGSLPEGTNVTVTALDLTEEDVSQLDPYSRYLSYSVEMETNGACVDTFDDLVQVTLLLPEGFQTDSGNVKVYLLDSTGDLAPVHSSLDTSLEVYSTNGYSTVSIPNGILTFDADCSGTYLIVTDNIVDGELVYREGYVPSEPEVQEELPEEEFPEQPAVTEEETPAEAEPGEAVSSDADTDSSGGGGAPVLMIVCVILVVVIAAVVVVVAVVRRNSRKKENK